MGQWEFGAPAEIILQSGALEEQSKLCTRRETINLLLLLNTAEMFVSSGTEGCTSYSKKRQSSQATTHNNGHMHEWKQEKNHPLCSAVHPFFAWRHNCVYWSFLLTRSAIEQLNLTFTLSLNSRLVTEQLNLTFNLSLNFRLILHWHWKCSPASDLLVIHSLDTHIYHTVCTSQFLQNFNTVLFS